MKRVQGHKQASLKKYRKFNPDNIPNEDLIELLVRTEEEVNVFINNYIHVVREVRQRCWRGRRIGGLWCLSHPSEYVSAFIRLTINFDGFVKLDILIYKPSIYFVGYLGESNWKLCVKFDETTGHVFDSAVEHDLNSFSLRYSNFPKYLGRDVLRGAIRRLQNSQNIMPENIKESIDTVITMFCEPTRLDGILSRITSDLKRGSSFFLSDSVKKLFRDYNTLCEAYTLSCEALLWEDIDKCFNIETRIGLKDADECKEMLGILKPVDIDACRERVSKNKAVKDPPESESDPESSREKSDKEGKRDKGRKKEKGEESEGGGDRQGVVPALGPWKAVKEKKDLDFPVHKVMVATVRCEEIGNEKFSDFIKNQVWLRLQLEEASQSGPIIGFGKKLSSIVGDCLFQYDSEAVYIDEDVRTFKRKHLEEKLFQAKYEALAGPVEVLLDGGNDDTWPSIKKPHQQETLSAVAWIASDLSCFTLNENIRDKRLTKLEVHARGLVEEKSKEEVGNILISTKDR